MITEERVELHPMVMGGIEAVMRPEVQELIKKLGEYNLGVCIPHMHNDQGEFQDLPTNIVAFESDLKVSFVDSDSLNISTSPVAWRWNKTEGQLEVIAACNAGRVCDGPAD